MIRSFHRDCQRNISYNNFLTSRGCWREFFEWKCFIYSRLLGWQIILNDDRCAALFLALGGFVRRVSVRSSRRKCPITTFQRNQRCSTEREKEIIESKPPKKQEEGRIWYARWGLSVSTFPAGSLPLLLAAACDCKNQKGRKSIGTIPPRIK